MKFRLFNIQYGETICLIEMDEHFLQEESKIVNSETLTLDGLSGGKNWTVIPITDDPKSVSIRNLHKIYERITTEPVELPSDMHSRMDALYKAVGGLFAEIEYYVVKSREDLQSLISVRPGKTPERITEKTWGDVLESNPKSE